MAFLDGHVLDAYFFPSPCRKTPFARKRYVSNRIDYFLDYFAVGPYG